MKNEVWLSEGLFSLHGKEVEGVFRQAVQRALWQHKRLGNSVAAWENDQVVIVRPEKIVIDKGINDLEIINRNADELNREAMDVLEYQVDIFAEVEIKDEV